jgi:hypothetical protein
MNKGRCLVSNILKQDKWSKMKRSLEKMLFVFPELYVEAKDP